jgi:penicillin amidase
VTPRHDMDSMARLQADQLSLATQRLLPYLRAATSQHALAPAAQQLLASYTGDTKADSAGALLFAVWVDELTRALLVPRLGTDRFTALYGKRQFRGTVESALQLNDAWWCAPIGCAAQATEALTRALDRLQAAYGRDIAKWRWGAAHPAWSAHRPFSNVSLLAPFFDVEVASGGDAFTVNVGQYWPSDTKAPFSNRHAASLRAIYDLQDLELSQFIYQTGQSGVVFSSRYRDMSDEWAAVRYRPLQMNQGNIRHTLTLSP